MALKVKPSSRIHLRYLKIKAKSKEDVEKAVLDYLGILGWAKSRPYFVKNTPDEIILAVERKMLNDVKAAFALVEGIKVLRVSGTLKGLGK